MLQHTDRPRIVYFRVVDPTYPRNRRIRSFLASRGHEVTIVPPSVAGNRALRHLRDLYRLARSVRRGDVIVVAEQYVRSVPVAAAVARLRGCRLVVDAFVGIHETAVDDWRVARPGSLRARRFHLQDAVALRVADCVLIDTDVRAAALRRGPGHPKHVITLPVGAPPWARPATATKRSEPLRVLYYGNYIPLHGLDVVLTAMSRTRQPVILTMLGDGARRPAYEALVDRLGLGARVRFEQPVPEDALAGVIRDHDVVLGVFGGSAKARSVIANKTWQGLACDRTVVTMSSPALDELAPIVGERLVQVDVLTGGPAALAAVLDDLATANPCGRDLDIARRLEEYTQSRFASFGAWLDRQTVAR